MRDESLYFAVILSEAKNLVFPNTWDPSLRSGWRCL